MSQSILAWPMVAGITCVSVGKKAVEGTSFTLTRRRNSTVMDTNIPIKSKEEDGLRLGEIEVGRLDQGPGTISCKVRCKCLTQSVSWVYSPGMFSMMDRSLAAGRRKRRNLALGFGKGLIRKIDEDNDEEGGRRREWRGGGGERSKRGGERDI